MTDLDFRLLGPLEIRIGGRTVEVTAAKHRVVLACLLWRAGRTVPVRELIANLWPDQPPAGARATVQSYISRLRRQLGEDLLATGTDGYRLTVPPESVDLHRFRALLAGGPDERGRLHTALGLWRGTALQGVPAARLLTYEVPALAADHLRTLERRVELDLAHNDTGLVAELSMLTGRHPGHEPFWRLLMLALARANRQGEALTAYQRARQALAAELGTGPGPALRAAYQSVLAGESRGPATSGWHPVHQLPGDLPGFVGRTELLAELTAALRPGAAVLLAGPPGVGKTALAVHLAHRLRARYPDGALHVNLHGYRPGPPVTPEALLGRLLRGIGVPADALPETRAELAELFRTRTRGRRLLVLLDNLVDPDLLPPMPSDGVLLATSRAELTLPGVRVTRVGVLLTREGGDLLASLVGADQVAAHPEAAGELLELCGGLPLALRIAAANAVHEGDLAAHVKRLKGTNRLAALAIDGDPDAAVHTAFALSCQRLSAPACRLFRLHGLLPGPDLTAPAASALIGADAGPLLAELTTAGLLTRDGDRYRSHDLLRLYAAGLAAQDTDAPAALAALTEHYAHTAASASPRWLSEERANLLAAVRYASEHGPHRTAHRLAAALVPDLDRHSLTAELTAVCEAGRRAAHADGDPEAEAALAQAQGEHLLTLTHYVAAREPLALARELTADPARLRALEIAELMISLTGLDGWASPVAAAERILREATEADDPDSAVGAVHLLAVTAWVSGDLAELVRQCERGLAMTEDPARRVDFLIPRAGAHWDRGELAVAAERYRETAELAERAGARRAALLARVNQAQVLVDDGRDEEALAVAHAVFPEISTQPDDHLLAQVLAVFGALHTRAGDYTAALGCHEEALAALGDGSGLLSVHVRTQRAEALRRAGRAEEALPEVLAVAGELSRPELAVLVGPCLLELASVHAALGRTAEAVTFARRSRDAYEKFGNGWGVRRTTRFLTGLVRA
ncbi:DNA-binding SARP family transcriptional activator/tetratricopeptide (TPR) repeat protein/energy-coupling factor transporter ATP-binding protein EcfA2 [Crossiella equi]|uniref:DNA-binding SARP family transcriptional activator/tetratricopeptide (TPR) repeat protein/energy-coupling factor transporter ATP-binding protein EcfA2 n=1 Tax=Crossiella equi TaxID=130796 RepID=A0ABS5A4E8_9PSEU|nr:BTAD domain-containing putative transcriptional regulator [Crossiella equi]MBP2471416.1 DNA-binding SARP family transcriptional activator/tetratricopeptide (TPR) repeat protein/energy-coupling factor transporter ATP-binding protein EcfA2 [Crossiella equi]